MNKTDQIETILLDMDGVLWRGNKPVLEIASLFKAIHNLGCQSFCVTNNSTKSVEMYQEALNKFGVNLAPEQFVTSAVATAVYLKENYSADSQIYLIGEKGLKDTIQKQGFTVISGQPVSEISAVVVGLDRDITYSKLADAVMCIQQGAEFVGTNPDRTIPTPAGPAPGAGAIIAAIEASSGVSPRIIGKPEQHLFRLALTRAGSSPEKTLMIGDRLETDILGAQKLGIQTCLVLTGISTAAEAENWQPGPDKVVPTARDAIEALEKNEAKLI